MSSVFTLLFAPTFLIFLHYFEFKLVVSIYLVFSFILLTYSYIQNKISKNLITPFIYVSLLSFAYFQGFTLVKFIPVMTSLLFLSLFIDATINKKELILKYTKKFYLKQLSDEEILFLKTADGYWVGATFISTLMQFIVTFYDDITWAFYSSIGWYIFFFFALMIQILYGRLYAIKMYRK